MLGVSARAGCLHSGLIIQPKVKVFFALILRPLLTLSRPVGLQPGPLTYIQLLTCRL